MTIELAFVRPVLKPWGRKDLQPFYGDGAGQSIGELWFTRSPDAPSSALLVKLLFTSQPLSIQVHPTDVFARSMGLPNGKSEAWIILDATPGASVALGLLKPLAQRDLRAAIENGSISDLVAWRPATTGDVFDVPAGTIHAIGAGLILAEIQQNSDTTFRLFDFGRGRDLQVDAAIATAELGPAKPATKPVALSDERSLLVAASSFIVERVALPGNSTWVIKADTETWLLPLVGEGAVDLVHLAPGQAVFLLMQEDSLTVGPGGLVGLLAYQATAPLADILRAGTQPSLLQHAHRDADGRASKHGAAPIARGTLSKATT